MRRAKAGRAVGRSGGRLLVLGFLLAASPPDRLAAVQCPDGSPPPCGASAARATAPAPTGVAVLYFDNLSPDSADAYLADGLTEEITSRLGDIERIMVKSRSAVRRFRDLTIPDPSALGRSLRVRYLVEGSVRRGGDRVRVAVRLVNAADGFRVWGEDYDRATGDLLDLQAEIAREVAAKIREGLFAGVALVALGKRDATLDFLERIQPRGAALWFLLRAPHFDPIRAHPRFQRLVEESRPR